MLNDCDINGCSSTCPERLAKSDEALAALRLALAGDPEPEVSYPCSLTVYCASGEVTVHNIREDSIKITGGVLKCEEDNNTSSIRIYHFVNVLGYSSVIA